jgi:hypothetical protein
LARYSAISPRALGVPWARRRTAVEGGVIGLFMVNVQGGFTYGEGVLEEGGRLLPQTITHP